MKSRLSDDFVDLYRQLPESVRQQAREAYHHFMGNPYHPSLHFKKVYAPKRIYSARVGLYYRVLGVLEDDEITWFWIGTHTDYDKWLR